MEADLNSEESRRRRSRDFQVERVYTRWNGRATNNDPWNPRLDEGHSYWNEMLHPPSIYLGNPPYTEVEYQRVTQERDAQTPFRTQEDLAWLNQEFDRRAMKENLQWDLDLLCVFAKALIPIAGLIWAIHTTERYDSEDPDSDGWWSWKEAITFHRNALRQHLG